jgi:hypothetical protein
MAINPANMGQLSQQAGQIILSSRNALQQIIYFNLYLQTIGHDGLVALGFSDTDAVDLLTVYGNLNSVAQMCNGGAYDGPALPFNFLQSTAGLWGGQ